MKRNEKGQLTIFLGISMMIIITLLAFIVNVGLFVKAKINLQNSVDAAAFSGAAVQARQLSNISYLNWEMRNTYKEWMFKYYVLGQISMSKINMAGEPPTNKYESQMTNSMLFRMNPFWRNTAANAGYYKDTVYDKYNVPSICISFSQTHNICELYAIPGLPRFETNGLMGVSEHHEAFLNTIVQEKSENCAKRTNLNFSVAMNWAYGTKSVIFAGTPEIASDRTGAWVQSIELALRIRNLETLVNRAPLEVPICAVSDGSCKTIDELDDSGGTMIPFNERPVKAFVSAYKNLGGDSNQLKRTFKLTEIPPRSTDVAANSLSGLLIPESVTIPGTTQKATQKYYLDLQAMPLNLVTFFTSFTAATEGDFGGGGTPSEASCIGSKTAIPVPGYILGFTKNPEFLTYYAVKGEASFMGLFFPFKGDGVKMAAYAAAKPFGGRIGPRLFNIKNNQTITPVTSATASQMRSLSYLSGIKINPGVTYKPGELIPTQSDFWIEDGAADPVGGVPTAGISKYAIPNLLYEMEDSGIGSLDGQASGLNTVQVLAPASNESDAMFATSITDKGLYDKNQFVTFYKNLGIPPGTIDFTPAVISAAIEAVRAPTKYEALNYMIPSFDEKSELLPDSFDSIPMVYNMSGNPNKLVYELYGPIFGPGTLYENSSAVQTAIYNYLYANEPSIQTYLDALKATHHSIIDDADTTEAGQTAYRGAAESIWKPTSSTKGTAEYDLMDAMDCNSIAGRFKQFFLKDQIASVSTCMIDSLSVSLAKYIDTEAAVGNYSDFYRSTYKRPAAGNESLMTSYVPGPRTGASEDGDITNEFITAASYSSKRNFYSTKFVQASRFFPNGDYIEAGVYKEVPSLGAVSAPPSFENPIEANSLSEFGSLINH